ncbi:hypothetical protein PQQ51_33940 [Paraburkholderia xenovorans]|uniref:hypothetical protein n=1 Tax=Paraburkholderia xenovorans TaxID=36873 RepID=UPI0038BAEED1
MPKRETFSSPIECKRCGKTGRATWEENENPVHGDGLDRELKELDAGFHPGKGQDLSGDVAIICDDCKIPVS